MLDVVLAKTGKYYSNGTNSIAGVVFTASSEILFQ
jgi:hypothetical protein